MESPWKSLFIEIARHAPRTCAYWFMKSGAEFYMNIPRESEIREECFSESVEFPFTFADIKAIEIVPRISVGEQSISNNFVAVKAIATNISTLGCEVSIDKIAIYGPVK